MAYPPLWSEEVEQRVRKEARNLDPQALPEKIVMCRKCVVTSARPRIVFDEEGICSACRYAERKNYEIDWQAREDELHDALAGNSRVIVPASGGKDSSFVATTLRDTYGMNVLAARWAPFMTTDIGERNWQSFIHSGFDSVTAQPNGLLHRKLARLALEFYGDPFQPFTYGQLCWPMHVAAQTETHIVFFGENGEAEYGGDPAANDKPCWDSSDWERVYHKGASVWNLIEIGMELGCISTDERANLSPFYTLPDRRRPEFHWLGYYLNWSPQQNFYHASENTGFECNDERSEGTYSKYASLDDRLDGWHYWFGWLKFGIGRTTSDAAHEIRDDELTRDEGLALVAKYDGEFPRRYHLECLQYLGLDDKQFAVVADRFNVSEVDWRAKSDADVRTAIFG